MKARDMLAARLETDYMRRVQMALSPRSLNDRMEILRQVRAELERRLAATEGEQITLEQMADAIRSIGMPEVIAEWTVKSTPAADATDEASSAQVEGQSPQPLDYEGEKEEPIGYVAPPLPPFSRADAAELLGKIWWGMLWVVVGVVIPWANLGICELVGGVIIARSILTRPSQAAEELRTAGELRWASVGFLVAVAAFVTGSRLGSALGLGVYSAFAGLLACSVASYWILMTAMARWVGEGDLAKSIRLRRNVYVFAIVAMDIAGSIVVDSYVSSPLLSQLYWLPFEWVTGYFFILAPIAMARRALLSEPEAMKVG